MEISETQTTYDIREYFLKHLPHEQFLGKVINPDYRDDNGYFECYEDINGILYENNLSCGTWAIESKEYIHGKFDDRILKKRKEIIEKDGHCPYVTLKETGEPLPTNVDDLIKLCEPSKYGDLKTQTTVLNEEVRKAYEIPGDKLELSDFLKNEILEDLLCETEELFPTLYDLYEFKLNKLNVYTEGCHFSTHVDTPKDRMIGTLVVELPYEYEGGEFVLNGTELNTRDGFLAFYSDTPHSIKRVEKGCRVSLTFYIMLPETLSESVVDKEGWNKKMTKYLSNMENKEVMKLSRSSHSAIVELGEEIQNLLTEEKKMGILLSHDYSNSEIIYGVEKGADAHLVTYLKVVLGLEVSNAFPVVVKHSEQWSNGDCDDDYVRQYVYRFCEEDIVATAAKMRGKKNIKASKIGKPAGGIKFICIGLPNGYENCAGDYDEVDREDYIPYTGNECQSGYMNGQYFQCAVFVSSI